MKGHYRRAFLVGLVGGAVIFLFRYSVASPSDDPIRASQELIATALAGSLLAYAIAFIRARASKRAIARHDRNRQIQITLDKKIGSKGSALTAVAAHGRCRSANKTA